MDKVVLISAIIHSTRTGRANVHMIGPSNVGSYGADMPLNQVAQVHAPEPNMITIAPFDLRSSGNEKGLRVRAAGFIPRTTAKLSAFTFPP